MQEEIYLCGSLARPSSSCCIAMDIPSEIMAAALTLCRFGATILNPFPEAFLVEKKGGISSFVILKKRSRFWDFFIL